MARLVIVIAALALLGAACGGERNATGGSATPARTTTGVVAALTATEQDHSEAEDLSGRLAGVGRTATPGFSAAYALRATVDGKAIDGTVMWYRRGTRVRADFAGTVADGEAEMSVISGPNYPAEDLLYLCRRDEQNCTEVRRVQGGNYPEELLPALIPLRLLDVSVFALGLDFYDESTRTVLEQPVSCFVGRSASEPAVAIDHGEVCLTETGVPVLVTAAGTGRTMSLTANERPGPVSESDFTLPYEIGQ